MSRLDRLNKQVATLENGLQKKSEELAQMQDLLDRADAEKISCDQGWATAMRELHQVRTDTILFAKKLDKAQQREKELSQLFLEEEAKRKEAEAALRKHEKDTGKIQEEPEVCEDEEEDEEKVA